MSPRNPCATTISRAEKRVDLKKELKKIKKAVLAPKGAREEAATSLKNKIKSKAAGQEGIKEISNGRSMAAHEPCEAKPKGRAELSPHDQAESQSQKRL